MVAWVNYAHDPRLRLICADDAMIPSFMQMITILPKVGHFFALTADWATFSFTKHEAALASQQSEASKSPLSVSNRDSTSEKEDDVLSFKPRRRGSRATSPTSSAANIRNKMNDDRSTLSSSSSVSDTTVSTAPTSLAGSEPTLKRRLSPNDQSGKTGGPVQRVLNEEMEGFPVHRRRSSDPNSKISRSAVDGDQLKSRRASEAFEDAITASAFVEASDLLKRRREDAVLGLGSALDSSDEEHPDDHCNPAA